MAKPPSDAQRALFRALAATGTAHARQRKGRQRAEVRFTEAKGRNIKRTSAYKRFVEEERKAKAPDNDDGMGLFGKIASEVGNAAVDTLEGIAAVGAATWGEGTAAVDAALQAVGVDDMTRDSMMGRTLTGNVTSEAKSPSLDRFVDNVKDRKQFIEVADQMDAAHRSGWTRTAQAVTGSIATDPTTYVWPGSTVAHGSWRTALHVTSEGNKARIAKALLETGEATGKFEAAAKAAEIVEQGAGKILRRGASSLGREESKLLLGSTQGGKLFGKVTVIPQEVTQLVTRPVGTGTRALGRLPGVRQLRRAGETRLLKEAARTGNVQAFRAAQDVMTTRGWQQGTTQRLINEWEKASRGISANELDIIRQVVQDPQNTYGLAAELSAKGAKAAEALDNIFKQLHVEYTNAGGKMGKIEGYIPLVRSDVLREIMGEAGTKRLRGLRQPAGFEMGRLEAGVDDFLGVPVGASDEFMRLKNPTEEMIAAERERILGEGMDELSRQDWLQARADSVFGDEAVDLFNMEIQEVVPNAIRAAVRRVANMQLENRFRGHGLIVDVETGTTRAVSKLTKQYDDVSRQLDDVDEALKGARKEASGAKRKQTAAEKKMVAAEEKLENLPPDAPPAVVSTTRTQAKKARQAVTDEKLGVTAPQPSVIDYLDTSAMSYDDLAAMRLREAEQAKGAKLTRAEKRDVRSAAQAEVRGRADVGKPGAPANTGKKPLTAAQRKAAKAKLAKLGKEIDAVKKELGKAQELTAKAKTPAQKARRLTAEERLAKRVAKLEKQFEGMDQPVVGTKMERLEPPFTPGGKITPSERGAPPPGGGIRGGERSRQESIGITGDRPAGRAGKANLKDTQPSTIVETSRTREVEKAADRLVGRVGAKAPRKGKALKVEDEELFRGARERAAAEAGEGEPTAAALRDADLDARLDAAGLSEEAKRLYRFQALETELVSLADEFAEHTGATILQNDARGIVLNLADPSGYGQRTSGLLRGDPYKGVDAALVGRVGDEADLSLPSIKGFDPDVTGWNEAAEQSYKSWLIEAENKANPPRTNGIARYRAHKIEAREAFMDDAREVIAKGGGDSPVNRSFREGGELTRTGDDALLDEMQGALPANLTKAQRVEEAEAYLDDLADRISRRVFGRPGEFRIYRSTQPFRRTTRMPGYMVGEQVFEPETIEKVWTGRTYIIDLKPMQPIRDDLARNAVPEVTEATASEGLLKTRVTQADAALQQNPTDPALQKQFRDALYDSNIAGGMDEAAAAADADEAIDLMKTFQARETPITGSGVGGGGPFGHLPPKPEGTVRLYHGQGEGGASDIIYFTDNPDVAAQYGDDVSYMDVPKEQAEQHLDTTRKSLETGESAGKEYTFTRGPGVESQMKSAAPPAKPTFGGKPKQVAEFPKAGAKKPEGPQGWSAGEQASMQREQAIEDAVQGGMPRPEAVRRANEGTLTGLNDPVRPPRPRLTQDRYVKTDAERLATDTEAGILHSQEAAEGLSTMGVPEFGQAGDDWLKFVREHPTLQTPESRYEVLSNPMSYPDEVVAAAVGGEQADAAIQYAYERAYGPEWRDAMPDAAQYHAHGPTLEAAVPHKKATPRILDDAEAEAEDIINDADAVIAKPDPDWTPEQYVEALREGDSESAALYRAALEERDQARATVAQLEANANRARRKVDRLVKHRGQLVDKLSTMPKAEKEELGDALQDAIARGMRQLVTDPGLAAPDEVAMYLDDMTKVFEPNFAERFFDKTLTPVVDFLKRWQIATPGFTWRNAVGNVWQNFIADVDVASYPLYRRLRQAANEYYSPNHGSGVLWSKLSSQEKEWAQTLHGMNLHGQYALSETGLRPNAFRDPRTGELTSTGQAVETMRKYQPLNPISSRGFLANPMHRLGRTGIDEYTRGALAVDVLKKGGSADDATHMLDKFHFNYADLSRAERNVKRVFPFYTWTRHNLPLQLEMMALKPWKYQLWTHLKRGVEEQNENRDSVVPAYVTRGLFGGIETPAKMGGGSVFLQNITPARDIDEITADPVSVLGGAITPAIKVPIEHQIGRRFFKGFKIGEKPVPLPEPYKRIPGLREAMRAAGWADQNKDGQWLMKSGMVDTLDQFVPLLGRARRGISDEPRFEDRRVATMVNMIVGSGLIRTNVRDEQLREVERRVLDEQYDLLHEIERKAQWGQVTEADWRKYRALKKKISTTFKRMDRIDRGYYDR